MSGADLRSTDDGLAGGVAASGHHLLGNENFLCRNLNAQVAPGNHHPITRRQDLVETNVGRGERRLVINSPGRSLGCIGIIIFFL